MTIVDSSGEINRRFSLALEYHRQVEKLTGVHSDVWLDLVNSAAARPAIALTMSLIHPHVVPLRRQRWLERRGGREFRLRPRMGRNCWAFQVWGYECPYNRGPLELDHAWPYALGGQSVPENALWLCKIHNAAKSSDVHCYHWKEDSVPSWVEMLIDRFRQDVNSGFHF